MNILYISGSQTGGSKGGFNVLNWFNLFMPIYPVYIYNFI